MRDHAVLVEVQLDCLGAGPNQIVSFGKPPLRGCRLVTSGLRAPMISEWQQKLYTLFEYRDTP